MTQDEKWQRQYDLMMAFMNENHRRPSKHRLEEHDMPKLLHFLNNRYRTWSIRENTIHLHVNNHETTTTCICRIDCRLNSHE